MRDDLIKMVSKDTFQAYFVDCIETGGWPGKRTGSYLNWFHTIALPWKNIYLSYWKKVPDSSTGNLGVNYTGAIFNYLLL